MPAVTLRLLIATTSKGKIIELTRLLGDLPFAITGLDALPQSFPPPEETGRTFADNALLKASAYAAAPGLLTLADDSGLEVDALDGAPGVHSARYAGAGASDHEHGAVNLRDGLSLHGVEFVEIVCPRLHHLDALRPELRGVHVCTPHTVRFLVRELTFNCIGVPTSRFV